MWDTIWFNGTIATLRAGSTPYGLIANGAIAAVGGRIAWVGPASELSQDPAELAREAVDLEGALVTPGLIDCHTHLVYGGNRAREFEMRLDGASYEEIARAGGGIVSSVKATRAASAQELYDSAARRLSTLMANGVTTIEIKSGYGLDTETEIKMLRVARMLGENHPIRVVTSFLGAHALPKEFAGKRREYIDLVCTEMLPAVHELGLADAVDGFCENIAFSTAEIEQVFKAAAKLGMAVKLHAEQLSDQKGAVLAARYRALSADHLEYLGRDGVEAMAKAGMVAVLLPGAFYCLKETQKPPVGLLRESGVPIAIATDANPGSSPVLSLTLILNMACTLFGLTVEEAMTGTTRHAAQALGLESEIGRLEPGLAADLAIWDVSEIAELAYAIGARPLRQRIFAGTSANIEH